MAIRSRADTELANGDWSLAIVFAAMAVESELVYLFMKWNEIDLIATRPATDVDREAWGAQWRDKIRTVKDRLNKVSNLLTGEPFDSFVSHDANLLQILHSRCPASQNAASPRDFFETELFRKRNRILHFGQIDFGRSDAEMSLTLGATILDILAEMDANRRAKQR
jgi:hypothetical protein